MATAVSAVANGGRLMEPRVIRAVVRDDHRDVVRPREVRRAISAETAATLTTIMEGVVSDRGTAKAARLERYQVAGKTGTASKLVNDHYSKTDFNASFVGFVPSRKPVFTILVVIDTPRGHGYYGGLVAAPIFKRIAEAALSQAGVAPTINPEAPLLVAGDFPSLPPRPPSALSLTAALRPVGGVTLMPDVSGLSAREAVRALSGVGLFVRIRGDGFVARQSPAPGEPVDPGGLGVVELRRPPEQPTGTRGAR
jgi:membrane peptidoglycan carboxypeptidase